MTFLPLPLTVHENFIVLPLQFNSSTILSVEHRRRRQFSRFQIQRRVQLFSNGRIDLLQRDGRLRRFPNSFLALSHLLLRHLVHRHPIAIRLSLRSVAFQIRIASVVAVITNRTSCQATHRFAWRRCVDVNVRNRRRRCCRSIFRRFGGRRFDHGRSILNRDRMTLRCRRKRTGNVVSQDREPRSGLGLR